MSIWCLGLYGQATNRLDLGLWKWAYPAVARKMNWGREQCTQCVHWGQNDSWSRYDTVWRSVPSSYSLHSFCPIIAAFLITRLISPASLCCCHRTMESLCMRACVWICVRLLSSIETVQLKYNCGPIWPQQVFLLALKVVYAICNALSSHYLNS